MAGLTEFAAADQRTCLGLDPVCGDGIVQLPVPVSLPKALLHDGGPATEGGAVQTSLGALL